uniref:PNPLA domain-containing protein n=1 Tax=Chaetoceros debilis TaxID=122233 RepID=A0A7S3Q201_9STRA
MSANQEHVVKGACPIGSKEDGQCTSNTAVPDLNLNLNLNPDLQDIEIENIYEYYRQNIFPAIASSLPLLTQKLKEDAGPFFLRNTKKLMHFLIPWTKEDFQWHMNMHLPTGIELPTPPMNFTQLLLRNFDSDNDGHISASELLHMNLDSHHIQAALNLKQHLHVPSSIPSWLHLTSWPLIDYNLGLLIWRSCGGILLVIVAASIIPGRLHGLSGRILRWPVLGFTYFAISIELIVYIMVRLFIRMAETVFSTAKHRALRVSLEKASTYNEWLDIARELDHSQGRMEWVESKDDDSSYRYNWAFINELIADMKQAREMEDVSHAMSILQQCTRKNVGGIMNEDLFSYTNSGEPKKVVREFLDEVVKTLRWVTDQCRIEVDAHDPSDSHKKSSAANMLARKKNVIERVIDHSQFFVGPLAWALHTVTGTDQQQNEESKDENEHENGNENIRDEFEGKMTHKMTFAQREEVKIFLKRARAAFGRTALCLSGGAMLGCYHFGHILALVEEGVLPHIISGTSAGSIIAAAVCTRTNAEMIRDFKPEILAKRLTCFTKTWKERIEFVREHGCMFDQKEWIDLVTWFTCGDMTFEEAYKKTGRILNVTLSSTTKKAPPVLVNYITAPNVTIASATVASSAVPGFIKPVVLMKKGPDGVVTEQGLNKDESYWDGSIDQDIPTSNLAEMFNCHFFLTAQCNPHIVPFFFNSKGGVGQPSRWYRSQDDDAWRGGFLLTAIEIYLRSDMQAKMHFLNDLEAALAPFSTMFTQTTYGGTTTIVPQVSFSDYFQLFSNPTKKFLQKCVQGGRVAAFKHCSMMKLHYSVSNAFDDCLAILEEEDGSFSKSRRRHSNLLSSPHYKSSNQSGRGQKRSGIGRGYNLNASAFPLDNLLDGDIESEYSQDITSVGSSMSMHDDECEMRGFDGVRMDYPMHMIT